MEIIRTNAVSKFFGTTPACDDISMHVNKGEIYGFLGLNGAGKTTLIRILLGMIKSNSGQVKLFGKELTPGFDQWNDIGYLVETPQAYPNLNVIENLRVFHRLRKLKDPILIDRIIEELKLTRYQNTIAKHLSLGNQQRLGLAKALLHRPKLLILDEPINGLDPEGIVEVRELLRELAQNGSTIFLSSHILGEISKVAGRIGIIHNGQLIKELTTEELSGQLIKKLILDTHDNRRAVEELEAKGHHSKINENKEIEVYSPLAIMHPEVMSQLLVEKGLPPRKVNVFTEDLEMFFLRVIREC